MQRIEYRTQDKSDWPRGPWDNEPDKIQWQDEVTGLPCLIVRGPVGALCGYVGVPKSHPAYGLSYDGSPGPEFKKWHKASREAMRKAHEKARRNPTGPRRPRMDDYELPPSPQTVPGIGEAIAHIEVHGGLTFANGCATINRKVWRHCMAQIRASAAEAKRYPRGDAAERVKEWEENGWNDFDKWRDDQEARAICHRAEGREKKVHWFGFDCAHAGDLAPEMEKFRKAMGSRLFEDNQYRDIAYVTEECESLALQLQKIEREYNGKGL